MASPAPKPKFMSQVKEKLLKPALTSHFQCWFQPTSEAISWIKNSGLNYNDKSEFISLSCSEASLPGSSFVTNEITSDFHGVTEKHVYRRQFDDRADFTFYVDHNGADTGNSHDIIWFFENWMSFIADESQTAIGDKPESSSYRYFYRTRLPIEYQTNIYINKFERDFRGTYLEYTFLQAYPIAINSMPVSYESSQLLKCNVSFSFTRYLVNRKKYPSSSTDGFGLLV